MTYQRPGASKPTRPDGYKLVFSPEALTQLSGGFDQLAGLVAVTLGPAQGPVVNAKEGGSVELLSDSGTIARRVVEVPDRCRNTGAMLLRNLVWRIHEQQGDGAATAAVVARAMVREAVRLIRAGIDPVLIRGGMEHALAAAIPALESQAKPGSGLETLSRVATGITADPELGAVLGEMFDFLGPNAAMHIEEVQIQYLDREYVEGGYWRAHPSARTMIPEGQEEVVLQNPLILLVDQGMEEVEDVQFALELAAQAVDKRPLLIIPMRIGEKALETLMVNHARGAVTVIATVLSSVGQSHTDDLSDIALMTGGEVLADARGRSPRRVQPAYFGSARKAIVTQDSLTIVGGAGNIQAVQERLGELQRRVAKLSSSEEDWDKLRKRIARLSGGIGILRMGANSDMELEHRREQAEKAFRVLTGVLEEGLVPGGGVAYLRCLDAVRRSRDTCPMPDQKYGVDVFATALEAPFKQIVRNHGSVHPPVALDEARRLGPDYGFDALTGGYARMEENGVLDSLRVVREALQAAMSTAISAITTDAIVLPPESKREFQATP